LRGLYSINVLALGVGIFVVFVLNAATPTDFILKQFADLAQKTGPAYALEVGKRLIAFFFLIALIGSPTLLVMRRLLRPISRCLSSLRAGQDPPADMALRARRRVINLPFIFIGFNVGMWIVIPAVVFFVTYMMDLMNLRTCVVFAIRASMVGFIASSIAFHRLEAYSRRELIPFFFPKGRLAELEGAANISISRRIRMFYRMGTLVPMTILLVTLFTLQWELDPMAMSAEEYGRRIIIFTCVLVGIFFISTGFLNRLVLGDAGNDMIRGLADREKVRAAFGKYVTPEIRDEILSGRIPLEGERREGTVMFADLRDFTPFVETTPPEEAISSMRAYFTAMHRAIRQHRGVVIQFVGDEIEAVFGVPVPFEGHADAAVQAALEMRRALKELNAERAAQGKSPFAHGIGIHSGSVLAGNSGSEEQSAYSLIGNTVNVASRIQGLTRELGCDILVSQETVDRLTGSFPMDTKSPRFVKGYSRPIIVHGILDADGS